VKMCFDLNVRNRHPAQYICPERAPAIQAALRKPHFRSPRHAWHHKFQSNSTSHPLKAVDVYTQPYHRRIGVCVVTFRPKTWLSGT
jgi:hypothetical protein